jgi:thiamine kinase
MEIIPALEARYQMRLTPLVGGAEARTFAGDGLVFKVYPPHAAQPSGIYAARLEALNMTKAGLGEWVVEAYHLEQYGVLVTRRYPGTNFTPERFSPAALDELAQFFLRLHAIPEPGVVSRSRLQDRLRQFGSTLHDLPQAQQLVGWLWRHVEEVAGTPQAFCHRDPHAGNILLKHPEAQRVPEALVVDWIRAQADDPARDLAILTTGTLAMLGEEVALSSLRHIVSQYPEPHALWRRLRFWVPLTYLHDMHWFRTKKPTGFTAAVAEKMPRALKFYQNFGLEPA